VGLPVHWPGGPTQEADRRVTGPQLGKEALLDAASALFDEHGVDAVSLSQINAASGHRNRSAASYHFGGKEAVIRALVDRHMAPVDARRGELLDQLEAHDPSPSVRAVVTVAVTPMSECLDELEGRRYLRLLGQLVGHPRYVTATQDLIRSNTSLTRCSEHLVAAVAPLPDELRIERVGVVVAFISRAYADQARLLDADRPGRPPLPVAAFTDHLVDLVVAMLAAPSTATH
jgi:AcrR family transcriptional regulator